LFAKANEMLLCKPYLQNCYATHAEIDILTQVPWINKFNQAIAKLFLEEISQLKNSIDESTNKI